VHGIYEPMMSYNVAKGELTPWLATGYEWSDDKLTAGRVDPHGRTSSDGAAQARARDRLLVLSPTT
jgi:peptide/nickel transport system substrate-binding protein